MDIRVLELSKYNPDKDIIIVNVNVGNLRRASEYLTNVVNQLAPLFRRKGFDSVFIPQNHDGMDTISISTSEEPSHDDVWISKSFVAEKYLNVKDDGDEYDPTSVVEDFVSPNIPDQRGSKVETLDEIKKSVVLFSEEEVERFRKEYNRRLKAKRNVQFAKEEDLQYFSEKMTKAMEQ